MTWELDWQAVGSIATGLGVVVSLYQASQNQAQAVKLEIEIRRKLTKKTNIITRITNSLLPILKELAKSQQGNLPNEVRTLQELLNELSEASDDMDISYSAGEWLNSHKAKLLTKAVPCNSKSEFVLMIKKHMNWVESCLKLGGMRNIERLEPNQIENQKQKRVYKMAWNSVIFQINIAKNPWLKRIPYLTQSIGISEFSPLLKEEADRIEYYINELLKKYKAL